MLVDVEISGRLGEAHVVRGGRTATASWWRRFVGVDVQVALAVDNGDVCAVRETAGHGI